MKNAMICTLAAMTLGSIGMTSTAGAIEIPHEHIHDITLPNNFAFKPLYKNNNTLLFRTGEIIFAQGSFNKKFMLKTPYGKSISTTRIYELLPNNQPLLVVRGDNSHVLGFVQLENYRRMQLFKRVTGIVYDRNGTNILKVQYPLASKHFEIYTVEGGKTHLLASTKKGSEGDFLVTFHGRYQDAGIDPLFLLTLFQLHASKCLFVSLADYLAIDEIHIDGLAAYAKETDGEKWIKGAALEIDLPVDEEEISRWQALKEKLAAAGHPSFVAEDRKEDIADRLAQRFDNDDDNLVFTLEEALDTLSEDEKSVLIDMIDSRL